MPDKEPHPPAKAATRRAGLTITDAIDPRNGHTCVISVSYHKLQSARKKGLGAAKELAFLVPATLRRPSAVYEGLMRDEDEDRGSGAPGWLCYVSQPGQAYNRDGSTRPPYPNRVFLVFVNQDRIAYNWFWAECDPRDENLPIGYAERFKKQVL
jgi:hypothetical protein